MRTNLVQTFKVGAKRMNLNRTAMRVALIGLFISLSVGEIWGSSYYTAFSVTAEGTGKGLVYTPSTVNTNTAPTSDSQYGASGGVGQSGDTGGSSKTNSYYAWAKAARGYAFDGWTIGSSNSNKGVAIDNASKQEGAKITVTSNVTDGTNTGTATAKWKNDPNAYTVTFGVPTNGGSYGVTYSYTTIEEGAFTTGGFSFSMNTSSSVSDGQKTSYKDDAVTVSTDAVNFDGWYDNSSFSGTALSTSNSYSFTVTGATSIYAKFKPATMYYGKVVAQIPGTPYSMPGGGKIFVSTISGYSDSDFSAETQNVAAETANMDATPPASVNQTYYLHAKPSDKRYVFRGWYTNPEGTGTALSTSSDYTYTFAVSSKDEANPTTKNVYACFDFNLYYMQVEARPSTPGLGMVLVRDNNSGTPTYTDYASYSEQFLYAYRGAPTANAYLYAKPKYGYKFSGWYDNEACAGSAKSTANPYTYTATGSSTDPLKPTIIPLYAKFVEDATTINITYNLPDQTKGEYKASVLDIAEVNDEFVWTFTEVFTSVGKTANTVQAQHKTDVLRLEATPKTGYGVTSWTDGSTTKTTPSSLYETTGTAAKTVGVAFGDAKPFLVSTNSTQYATLREALTAVGSSGKITVVQNAYVEAGDYTIPSGVSLIVPYESTGATYTSPSTTYEKNQAYSSASQYVLLTLGSDANITVAGSLYVMADLCAPNGGGAGSGAPATAFGRIEMSKNSTITINNSANLYCWGFVTGIQGLVTVKNGGKVHEVFQHQNNPGGSAASGWNEKAFFLNQYYVQNVESPLKIEYGATETVYAQMTVPSGSIKNVNAALVGTNDTGLFGLTSSGSYLVRTYNPATDRTTYDIYGNAKLNYISMTIYTMTIDTRNYILPITSNMSVKCHTLNGSASTFSVPYAVSFLPGAELIVDEGVTVNISSKLIIYDRDEWIGNGFAEFSLLSGGGDWTRSSFTPTRTYTRVKADLVDAKVDLNGTMSVSGSLYTTSNGAAIISSNGTGTINLSAAAPGNSNDIQYTSNKLGTSVNVPMTPAKLLNGDNSYTLTAGSVSGDKFIYSKPQERWLKNPKTITWDANGGTTDAGITAYSDGDFLGALPAAYKDGYTLVGWFTASSGGTEKQPTDKVTANAIYYAHWTPCTYTITYKDQGNVAFSGNNLASLPATHTYNTATPLVNGTKAGYSFDGWFKTPSCSGTAVISIPASEHKNITLYAKWTKTAATTNVTLDRQSGTGGSASVIATYGVAMPAATMPTRTGYTFGGYFAGMGGSGKQYYNADGSSANNWDSEDATKTLYAKWTLTDYTITHGAASNGTYTIQVGGAAAVSTNTTANYGQTITLAATPNTGYHFESWSTSPSQTITSNQFTMPASDVTVNAAFAVNTHKLIWNWNGGSTSSTSFTAANNSLAYGSTITYPANNTMTKTGYTFTGWSSSPSGNPTAMPDADLTITAQWEAITYNITYNLNGGTQQVSPTPAANYTIESAAITLPTPTKDGFEFAGWYANSDLSTGGVQTTIAAGSTGNKEYWAKWNSLETGIYVDIVDVDNSAKTLTLNVTNWPSAGWSYTINGVEYANTDREDDRTLIIPYTGAPGADFVIDIKKQNGDTYSHRSYKIPEVISSATLTADKDRPLFVKGGTLTINGDITTKNIYVGENAKLVINADKTLTADTIFLRTKPLSAAQIVKNGFIAAKTKLYYTRIIKDKSRYYQFGLPLSCSIDDVKLSDGKVLKYSSAWLLREYSESSRAQNGGSANNWTSVADHATIEGGKGYEMFSASNYYREFYFPVDHTQLEDNTSVVVSHTMKGAATDRGWNVLVSPLTATCERTTSPEGVSVCWMELDGWGVQEQPSSIPPAKPFAYQASENQSVLSFQGATIILAPRRVPAAEEPTQIQWIHLDVLDANRVGDQTSIYVHPTR